MSDSINHPPHYAGIDVTIECIDLTRHLNFQLGNAVKYLWRAGKKGGKEQEIEDLRKALWYLQDYEKNWVENTSYNGARAVLQILIPHCKRGDAVDIARVLLFNCNIQGAINLIQDRLEKCSSPS